MNDIIQGVQQAFTLIITGNPEVYEIAMRSLYISLSAVILASLFAIPIGGFIHFHEFRGKRAIITIVQTLYSVPTVVVGLLVYLLISRSGPLGMLGLLYTPNGMIFGQMILILPLLIGLTISALSGVDKTIRDTLLSLGATDFQSLLSILNEARFAILAAIILGFGRAISEVGLAMMIGGNIRGATRVLTTDITLQTSMGEIPIAIALGIILLSIALVVTLILNIVQDPRIVESFQDLVQRRGGT
jgi:tungstate transport system permease protein